MYVSDWMTKKVFTIETDDYLSTALSVMKEKGVKHLPVVKGNKLKGLVSDRDIKEYSPSKATSLDIYELHYLLANTRIKELMRTKVATTTPETPVEEAAMRMLDENIGCLPVQDNGNLVGIISDKDIFHALVDITGVRHGGNRICVTIEDRPGSIREVADIIRQVWLPPRGDTHLLRGSEGRLSEGGHQDKRKGRVYRSQIGDRGCFQDLPDQQGIAVKLHENSSCLF